MPEDSKFVRQEGALAETNLRYLHQEGMQVQAGETEHHPQGAGCHRRQPKQNRKLEIPLPFRVRGSMAR
jgi:hypothetical protein